MIARCPSCGAPPSLESKKRGACEYCGTAYEIAPKCRSGIVQIADYIACYVDTEMVGELVSEGLITMREGQKAMWPYYARCYST